MPSSTISNRGIRFGELPSAAAQRLTITPGQAGLIKQLRGYTLRNRPLYYQSVYAGPFEERLLIARENGQ